MILMWIVLALSMSTVMTQCNPRVIHQDTDYCSCADYETLRCSVVKEDCHPKFLTALREDIFETLIISGEFCTTVKTQLADNIKFNRLVLLDDYCDHGLQELNCV